MGPAALLLVLLVALALAAAACGGSSSASSDPVAKAATASAKEQAEHVHFTSRVTANGTSFTVAGDGDFANDPLLGSLASTATVGGHPVKLSEVTQGTKIYLSSDLFSGEIPGGKPWMSIDYGKLGGAQGVSVVSAASQSPTDALRRLELAGDARKVGEATLDGVHTTHYVATIDAKKLAKLDGGIRVVGASAPADAWIDDQGLVRKEHVAFTNAASGATPATHTDTTLAFSDYGETIHVSVPAAANTYDATPTLAAAAKGAKP